MRIFNCPFHDNEFRLILIYLSECIYLNNGLVNRFIFQEKNNYEPLAHPG